jgi:hypothetical protein
MEIIPALEEGKCVVATPTSKRVSPSVLARPAKKWLNEVFRFAKAMRGFHLNGGSAKLRAPPPASWVLFEYQVGISGTRKFAAFIELERRGRPL